MAELLLLRHAKSDWGTGLADHDRPLNDRGRKAAAAMGHYMQGEGLLPDLVICSTAVRARQTLACVTEAGQLQVAVQYEPALYGASASAILEVVRRDGGAAERLLLVGHNPGFQDVAIQFSEHARSEDARSIQTKYPTCALSVFRLRGGPVVDGIDGKAELIRYVTPRMIAG